MKLGSRYLLNLAGFHDALKDAWNLIEKEWTSRLLDYEADVQASTYHHLREAYDIRRRGFRIWSEARWSPWGWRPDLSIQLGSESRWVALEFKWLYGGSVRWARGDVGAKLKRYSSRTGKPARAYFCFVSESKGPDHIRRLREQLDGLAEWARDLDFLYFAEGFFVDKGYHRPRRALEPWKIRPACQSHASVDEG